MKNKYLLKYKVRVLFPPSSKGRKVPCFIFAYKVEQAVAAALTVSELGSGP